MNPANYQQHAPASYGRAVAKICFWFALSKCFFQLFSENKPPANPHQCWLYGLVNKKMRVRKNLFCRFFLVIREVWESLFFVISERFADPKNQKKTNMNTTTNDNAKLEALASFLGCELEELSQNDYGYYGLDSFELGSNEYAIGTDSEADDACSEYIRESAWAFNASFILGECGLPYQLEEAISSWQAKECESANDGIVSLIEKTCGIDSFIQSAISADGRGHFLSSYDGEENEEGDFFIYRIN